MAGWKFCRGLGFGITVVALLASCSVPPAEEGDSVQESENYAAIVDTNDGTDVEDVFNSIDILVDSFEDGNGVDDRFSDDIEDVADIPEDGTSDVLVCGDVPQEGCPCDSSTDEPCCLMVAKGLSCDNDRLVNGVLIYAWGVFWDCGCIEGPECAGYEICV